MTTGAHEHGSLAEEAARLVDAFSEMAAGWSRGTTDAVARTAQTELPSSCRVCPVCQVIARVQEVHPEVVGHLADATSSLAAALSELASSRDGEAPRERPAPEQSQHIDIGD